jgi:hypothetical protein
MPDLELHGYTDAEAERLKKAIDPILQELNLGPYAITNPIPSRSESCDGKRTRAPFIRVYSTDPAEITRILDALENGGVNEDAEWLVLSGFRPKKKMDKEAEPRGNDHEV